jgi:hypothetical protein
MVYSVKKKLGVILAIPETWGLSCQYILASYEGYLNKFLKIFTIYKRSLRKSNNSHPQSLPVCIIIKSYSSTCDLLLGLSCRLEACCSCCSRLVVALVVTLEICACACASGAGAPQEARGGGALGEEIGFCGLIGRRECLNQLYVRVTMPWEIVMFILFQRLVKPALNFIQSHSCLSHNDCQFTVGFIHRYNPLPDRDAFI